MGERSREVIKIRKTAREMPISDMELAIEMLGKGIEYVEPGLVFPLIKEVAKNPSEKRAALFVLAKSLINQNRTSSELPTLRNILQDGGSLRHGEWIGICELQGSKYIYGTRGVHKIR